MSRGYAVHICSFDALDIPKKHHGDEMKVLAAVARAGMFSVFEATDTLKMAKSLDWLADNGFFAYTNKRAYPWVTVEITDKGRAAIAKAEGAP